MEKTAFSSLGLSPELLKAVAALGFEEASPIQAAAIPVLQAGGDMIGQSQTGSGKTAAFGIPAIEKVDASNRSVQVLILCPTRELATQVADDIHKLSAFKKGISAVPIYGGASYERQFYELNKGVQIVIGTPGRIIDHLERGTLKLANVHTMILDEADRMLDMGFRDEIEQIFKATPKERQTVFFSATLSNPVKELTRRYGNEPQIVKIEPKEMSSPAIEQLFYETPQRAKLETLLRLIDFHNIKLGIIFCNTQRMVDELADSLIAQGFAADRLHGGMAQAQRTRVMNKFKSAAFEFLVATDVAARGIDVDSLELVVNYDLPYDVEDYVHRIGRTGRAGKRGMAMTFVSGRDIYKLQFIERYTKTKIRRGKIPTSGEIEERRNEQLIDRVRKVLEEDLAAHTPMVERFLEEGVTSTDLAAALFRIIAGAPEPADTRGASSASDRPARAERPERAERSERPERAERPERSERPERVERPERSERPERTERPERPVREEKRAPREDKFAKDREPRPEARDFEKPAPAAARPSRSDARPSRRPAPGMQWVCVSVGRNHDAGPRDIVSIVADSAGLPHRFVGLVELSDSQSFAQIPESAKTNRASGTVSWQDVPVDMWASQSVGAPPRTGGGAKFKKGRRD